MWFKIVHIFFVIFFSLIDFPRKHYEQIQQVNYLAFLRFFLYVIFMMLIQINEALFSEKNSSFAMEYMKISRYLLGIFAGYFAFNLLFYLPDYTTVFLLLGFYISVFFLFVVFDSTTKRNGINETIFTFILIPTLLFLSQIVMFSIYDLDSFLAFAPCNSLFFILCVSYTSQQKLCEHYESKNYFSISRLLGKQDSFRVILLLLGYCYFSMVFETFKKKTLL